MSDEDTTDGVCYTLDEDNRAEITPIILAILLLVLLFFTLIFRIVIGVLKILRYKRKIYLAASRPVLDTSYFDGCPPYAKTQPEPTASEPSTNN
uniref:M125R n=1 Tax=Panagrellus redivivus TaxID=6233 RepID=A0A7E4W842_PANRE